MTVATYQAPVGSTDGVVVPAPTPGVETPAPAAASPSRPEWLLDKFNSAEEQAKAYKSLEQEFSRHRQMQRAAPVAPQPVPGFVPPVGQPAPAAPVAQGFDLASIDRDLREFGTVTDNTLRAHAQRGIQPQVIVSWIEGEQAKATLRASKVIEMAGGQEAYEQLKQWGTANLTEEEQAVYNQSLKGSPAMMKMAINDLKARYQAARGGQQGMALISEGSPAQHGSAVPFRSKEEMQKAFEDPRYQKDPAYRNDLYARIGVSKF